MSIYKFIIKSLWYFRRQHFAVFLGTIISTAVLTGALIVGDSVKFSLRKLVEARLGNTEYALQTGTRFVRTQLASDIANKLNITAIPVLKVQGISINPETEARINTIQVLGIDNSFWHLSKEEMPELKDDEAIISKNIAQKLNLSKGDKFLLRAENANVIPLNAPFVSEGKNSVAFRLTIIAIAGDDQMGRFSLKSNQAAPYNVFLSQEFLAEKLKLSGRINIILITTKSDQNLKTKELNKTLKEVWQLADAGIKIREINDSSKFEVFSERVFIDEQISESILKANDSGESILTYLVNAIRFENNETPYSFVTAASSPITPKNLKGNEVIINEWLAQDLDAGIGDTIFMDYFVIGPLRTLNEETTGFIIKNIIPTQSDIANNSLMPSFPGLSDAGSCRDWETGVPINLEKIRDKDERYWIDYKGTPKAFVSIEAGHKLWTNRYGNLTAIRFDKNKTEYLTLKKEILNSLNPTDIGLFFLPVYNDGMAAVNNSVDFGGLFLSLSFFVIVAGILLTLLIYSLNTESRKLETGILSGLGFSRKKIINIRFGESIIIVFFGCFAGAMVGILYNYFIIAGLNSVWQDIVRTNMLEVYVKPSTLFIGGASGFVIALSTIYFVTRRKLKQPIAGLIKNNRLESVFSKKRKIISGKLIAVFCLIGTIFLISYSIYTSIEKNAGLFLAAGGLFLVASVALINLYFNKSGQKSFNSNSGLIQLAKKNSGRNKARSITTIILLALGTFSILITGANRKTFYETENDRQSGTGGFLFWIESTMPILYNLNTENGKSNLGIEEKETFINVDFIQLFSFDGDDASCLNLNQVQRPRILGVDPEKFNKLKAFSFAKLVENVDKDNVWLELNGLENKDVIPAIADQTVITWGLKKQVGDTLIYYNESGEKIYLKLIGGLNNSIFQGNILICDSLFMKHFPSNSGSKIMLVDAPTSDKNRLSTELEKLFTDYGMEITPASEKLAQFYSVENTYLTVFMILGGLGVIIGTFGFGIVLLRNILDRRHEVALYKALGFTKQKIFNLIFIENMFLLIIGLVCGIAAAVIGILPSLLSPSFIIPWTFVLIIVIIIFINGIIWIYFPARKAMKGVLIDALRSE